MVINTPQFQTDKRFGGTFCCPEETVHKMWMSTLARVARPALQRSTSAVACQAGRACRRPGHAAGPLPSRPTLTHVRGQQTLVSASPPEARQTVRHARALEEERLVEVEWDDGGHSLYPLTWLRDNCQCPLCTLQSAQARQLLITDLDIHSGIHSVEVINDNKVSVVWPDQHTSVFDAEWLKKRCFSSAARQSLQEELFLNGAVRALHQPGRGGRGERDGGRLPHGGAAAERRPRGPPHAHLHPCGLHGHGEGLLRLPAAVQEIHHRSGSRGAGPEDQHQPRHQRLGARPPGASGAALLQSHEGVRRHHEPTGEPARLQDGAGRHVDLRQLASAARTEELRHRAGQLAAPGGRLPGLGRGHVAPADPPQVRQQARMSFPGGQSGAAIETRQHFHFNTENL
uniref:Butyrobetaine (gamma), 2-oxoglutarate dioxygenase (gamma-butyrobetaine hydroxylase) 1 n=1 Tax=Scophthalmus maximus TaxID=52904 RepID=A0A8D3BQB0_SCOMX